jgi:hypothetical protein
LAGKSPSQAVEQFLRPIQRAVSCVTPEVFAPTPRGRGAGEGHAITLARGDLVGLRGVDFGIRLTQHYDVTKTGVLQLGPWKVRTAGYFYSLEAVDDESEVIAFHWHPSAPGASERPHLHVRGVRLDKAHIPTGRIAIEQVIALAVELGAEPTRDDWADVLAKTLGRHEEFRTWDRAPRSGAEGD